MASGKKRGKGEGRGRWEQQEHGETGWAGDGDGWIITATATVCTPYCVRGRSRNSEGGSQGAHLHPQSGNANEAPGPMVLDSRTVTPVQSLLTSCSLACDGRQFGWRRPPRAVGGVCPGTRYRSAAVGQWSSDRGVAGTTHPCPAENTSHFPTSQTNQQASLPV